jgi:tetratricopeptide (TPR) repeat protein
LAFSAVLGAADTSNDAWKSQLHVGQTLASQGHLAEARKALELARSQAEAFSDARLAFTLNELGVVELRLNDLQAAVQGLRRASAIWQTSDPRNAITPLTNLAAAYLGLGQYRSAETVLHEALPRAETVFGPDDARTVTLETYLAQSAFNRNDYKAVAAWGERVLATARRTHLSADPALAIALDNLGMIYRTQGRVNDSSSLFADALAVLQRGGHSTGPPWISALEGAGLSAFDARRYPEAESLLNGALARSEETFGPQHPQTARLLRERAAVLRKTGRKSEARSLEARAASIERQSAQDNGLNYTVDILSPTRAWTTAISDSSASPPTDGSTLLPRDQSVGPQPAQRR